MYYTVLPEMIPFMEMVMTTPFMAMGEMIFSMEVQAQMY